MFKNRLAAKQEDKAFEAAQEVAGGNQEDDAITVASSAIDKLSVVPSQQATEALQGEYKKLLEEYEGICTENQRMEREV